MRTQTCEVDYLMMMMVLQDAGIQQLGFLLGSCAVKVALTSEGCYKVRGSFILGA